MSRGGTGQDNFQRAFNAWTTAHPELMQWLQSHGQPPAPQTQPPPPPPATGGTSTQAPWSNLVQQQLSRAGLGNIPHSQPAPPAAGAGLLSSGQPQGGGQSPLSIFYSQFGTR